MKRPQHRPGISVDIARRMFEVRSELTRLSLDTAGHDELWGCLRAAGAAVEECSRICSRDLDRDLDGRPKAPRKERK